MTNNSLKISVNEDRILSNICDNLGIPYVNSNSNIKKLSNAYVAENKFFADQVNIAIDGMYISTMSDADLEAFGMSIGIYRKVFNSVKLLNVDQAAYIKVELNQDTLLTKFNQSYKLFGKNSIIYSNNYVTIKALTDLYVYDIGTKTYVSVLITAINSEGYTIEDSTVYTAETDFNHNNSIPTVTIGFDKPVGLTEVEESFVDYRARIYQTVYEANNGANTVVSSITKEVPYLYTVEVDDYTNGRDIKTIYPYTEDLLSNGNDVYIDSYIVPLLNTSLNTKVLYGNSIDVKTPEPLIINITINFYKLSDTVGVYFHNTVDVFNKNLFSTKSITKQQIEDFIYRNSSLNKDKVSSIDVVFISPYVSEESFTLSSEVIELPLGRFLHISDITSQVA